MNQRITGSIPSQGTCLGCRPGPQERQPHIDLSFLLSPSLPLSLKKRKKERTVTVTRLRNLGTVLRELTNLTSFSLRIHGTPAQALGFVLQHPTPEVFPPNEALGPYHLPQIPYLSQNEMWILWNDVVEI